MDVTECRDYCYLLRDPPPPATAAAEKTEPMIGAYIAAASTVCCLLMLYDIVQGSRKRQRWLPCKLFKLDPVTLALIAIVVKITVDISDDMPRELDQLSKLAGTTSLCIYMCYIFPSVGDMKDSTNMFALSILVITVCVNMCIQFSTFYVIHKFVNENIIIASLMMLLLVILWHFFLVSKTRNRDSAFICKDKLIHGASSQEESFVRRLKICYLYGYAHNPQFASCKQIECGIVGDISLICFSILIQAAFRAMTYEEENLPESSESIYKWSMPAILTTQVVTVMIGTFASYFRRCAMTRHMCDDILRQKLMKKPKSRSNPIWKYTFFVVNATNIVFVRVIWASWFLQSVQVKVLLALKSMVRCASTAVDETVKEFEDLYSYGFDEWLLRKSVSDMAKVIESSKRKSIDLCALLSEILPPPQSAGNTITPPRYQGPTPRELIESHETEGIEKRLLSMVVLVRIAEVAIPERLNRNRMIEIFKGAFETLHFIEKHLHKTSLEKVDETEVAKTVWMTGDFRYLLSNNQSDRVPLDHAIHVIQCVERTLLSDGIQVQLGGFRDLRSRRTFSSVEELWCFMEDLFVDMLESMLAQLPEAIFITVSGSDVDNFQEQVRESLEHLCKFESWDGIHRWKPPKGCKNCSEMVTPIVLPIIEQDESLYLRNMVEHAMAAKVAEVLLKMDRAGLLHLLGYPEALKEKLAEAVEMSRNVNQQQKVGKVAKMLMEMNVTEVLQLLDSPEALKEKVAEAMEMPRKNGELYDVNQNTGTTSQNDTMTISGQGQSDILNVSNDIIFPGENPVRITNDDDDSIV